MTRMTRMDRFICLFIDPFCHAEAFVRRVGRWVAEKALDRHVLAISRRISEDDDE